jgi:hypothetical protein
MKTQMTTTLRSAARKAVMALGVLVVMGGVAAAPAFANGRDDQRYEFSRRNEHRSWRADERGDAWRGARFDRHYAYARPSYYGYAAPRYYAPPPVYYPAPGFSLDFTVPLR